MGTTSKQISIELEKFNINLNMLSRSLKKKLIPIQDKLDLQEFTPENKELVAEFYNLKILGMKGLLTDLESIDVGEEEAFRIQKNESESMLKISISQSEKESMNVLSKFDV